jgi:competence protein ComEC
MTTERRSGRGPVTAVAVSLAAAAGAALARPVPLAAVLAVVALAGLRRSPALLVVAALVATSWSGARATAGLHAAPGGRVDGWVTLVDDPVPFGPSVRAILDRGGHRYVAWARGGDAHRLLARNAGQMLRIRGQIRPGADAWLRVRHVAGQLVLEEVGDWRPGNRLTTAANRVRGVLAEGLGALSGPSRALAAGLVYGDDRFLTDQVVDQFRASGLAHLTAVSGQNVAVVLALAGPLLSRLGRLSRAGTVVALVGLFALVTRAEPSVLRAGTMAVVGACTAAAGRPARGITALCASVVGLLLLDPFLVRSVGFALSVSATTGILLLSPWLARHLRGPRGLAQVVAVSLAAQLGVAPVGLLAFGTVEPVGPVANLAAVPVAGLVMVWGSSIGVVAGLVAPVAGLLHLPTRVGVWWVASVARVGAAAPAPVAWAATTMLLAVLWRRPPPGQPEEPGPAGMPAG